MRSLWLLGGAAVLAGLIDCTDILGLAPTDLVADPPAFDPGCALSVTKLADNESGILQIVADDTGVFWIAQTDAEDGYVHGYTNSQFVEVAPTELLPVSITLNADYVFWNTWNTYFPGNLPSVHAWARATHSRAASVELPVGAGQLALDSNALYFGEWQADGGGLWQLPLPLADGSAPQQIAAGLQSPFHIVTDSQNVYFDEGTGTAMTGSRVSAATIDGGAVNQLDPNTNVEYMAVNGGTVYWAGGGANVVTSIGVDGGGETTAHVVNPVTISVDSTWIYAVSVDNGRGAIVRTTAGNLGDPQKCVTGLIDAGPIAVAGSHVYFSAQSASGTAIYDLVVK